MLIDWTNPCFSVLVEVDKVRKKDFFLKKRKFNFNFKNLVIIEKRDNSGMPSSA